MVKTHTDLDQTTIILTPNRSASWQQSKLLLIGLGTFVFLVAMAWTIAGAWVVLPFAGFEVALLSLLMYQVSRSTYQQQVITIATQAIKVECGIGNPSQTFNFDVQNTHLEVIEPEHSMDKVRLSLTNEQLTLEIGAFLNQQDCSLALNHLQEAGLIVCSNRWWQSR